MTAVELHNQNTTGSVVRVLSVSSIQDCPYVKISRLQKISNSHNRVCVNFSFIHLLPLTVSGHPTFLICKYIALGGKLRTLRFAGIISLSFRASINDVIGMPAIFENSKATRIKIHPRKGLLLFFSVSVIRVCGRTCLSEGKGNPKLFWHEKCSAGWTTAATAATAACEF